MKKPLSLTFYCLTKGVHFNLTTIFQKSGFTQYERKTTNNAFYLCVHFLTLLLDFTLLHVPYNVSLPDSL